jgi:hypothetical protein
MRARLIGAAASSALHALVLASMIVAWPKSSPPPPPKHTSWKYTGTEAPVKLRGADRAGMGLACVKSYIGVGVQMSFTDRVMEVGINTPAERAGVQVGDHVTNSPFDREDWRNQRTVTLIVSRGGVAVPLVVEVGKICQD